MSMSVSDWICLIVLAILCFGFLIIVVRFLLGSTKKNPQDGSKASKDIIQPPSTSKDTPGLTVTIEKIGNTSPASILLEEIKSLIRENGIAIYAWKRECYKCHKETTVYSYYIIHDLKKVLWGNFGLDQCPEIGLGYIPALDKLVAEHFPAAAIRQRYSNSEGESYFANGCSHCDCLQGRYYVVDDPHEIIDDLWDDDGNMEKYLVETISVPEPIIDDIAEYIVKNVLDF